MMGDLGLGIIVSLKDAFSRNAARVQSSMQTLDASVEAASENMTRNLGFIEKGTMMVGAGLALLAIPAGLVASTAATQSALGELASVGVKDFRAMEDAAESFTNKWAGTQKAEFITAAYDVKSALANLSDAAVGTFASMAALTAKATKATTQEMVGTFTTAYGIFKPLAKDMSDIDWAKMFSGALAQTVSVFKTTGPAMAEAIKNIGAIAAASNVPLQEQMAILGQLQTTMPGSEAGTLYKAFMMKVAEAGNELGLSFVDTNGRLKSIIPILEEVKRKFPDLSQAAVQVKLKKAFGSDEAVRFLLQMSMGMDQLKGNILSVEQAMKSGTATTEKMAGAMNIDIGSQYGLIRQQLTNLFEILGRTFLPVVLPIMQGVSRFILNLQNLARSAPGVTRAMLTLCTVLGLLLVAIGGVISAIGTVGLLLPAVQAGIATIGPVLAGVGAAVSASFWPVVAVVAAVVLAVVLLKRAWETNFAGVRSVVVSAWNNVTLAFQGILALMTSLRNGTGQISADLAKKLQTAGLMGFVTTVFQVYFRVRQFLTGLWQAFSSTFGRVRAILEPVAKELMGVLGELGKALGSVFAALGMASTAADASSFQNIGVVLGRVLGVIAQVGAYVLRFVISPLVFIIKTVALVVRAVAWLTQTIVTGFATAEHIVYKFYLPLRMVVQGLLMIGRVAWSVWQILSGQVSVIDGLRSIGSAIYQYLATPFLWARDVAVASFAGIRAAGAYAIGAMRSLFGGLVGSASSAWSLIRGAAHNAFSSIVAGLRSLVTGAFQSGQSIMTALASGIRSAVSAPYEAAKSALARIRRLLPHSDALEGPLSTLTRSGSAMLESFSSGITRASKLPAQALRQAFGAARSMALPTAVAGTMVLTPSVVAAVPKPVTPMVSAQRITNSVADTRHAQLLSATRGTLNTGGPSDTSAQNLQPIFEAILAKLDALGDRPIDVSVTTNLDGRKIAQSVYKDMRDKKVRNYEPA